MPELWLLTLTFAAAIGSGLIAGVFFAFSTFVMKALARRPAAEAIPAMQSINIVVINPMFLGVFLGTAVISRIGAFIRWQSSYAVLGAICYVIGTFGVTIVCNVPLNNALAKVEPSAPDAAGRWSQYVRRWTMWNHVRTLAATAAM